MKESTPSSTTVYQIVFLIRKAKKEGLTVIEAQVLNSWLDQDIKNLELYNKLLVEDDSDKIEDMLSRDTTTWYNQVKSPLRNKNTSRWIKYGSLVAAASIALYFLFSPHIQLKNHLENPAEHDANEVTLSTGSVQQGFLVHADSVYFVSSLLKETKIESHIADKYEEPIVINTPIGKTIAIKLEDGSVVYLNSNSQISFYKDFDLENERKVSLNGEAFFEVAHDTERPFIVENNGHEIKVLGTSFNVNGFDNRSKFKLGLVEGLVEVNIKDIGYSKVVTPGFEVMYDRTVKEVVQKTKEIHQIGLWRTGIYAFEDITIMELTKDMEQLYPIRFVYEGEIPKFLFSGEISREEGWEKVLNKLELTNRVSFNVDGRTITVRAVTAL